ncbi:excinuclease ABC subunit UvrA [Thermodesulforhabdus norvegica]|uniref:UvrABC system protein A n=1 Tax=Thermodesulforhabdus norvegica TaxID=39841 RepID=A0A1I4TGD7_9BACT|nr:excinuclease ABC subunit UvrA [Thermodesulforhabdus norvegica]SFM75774.1 excinuclease ABC subunit A [Thermodesulforhabdus norvegica]
MFIRVRGARQHNLKNVDCNIPLYGITGICGVSGSGKSTLAFHVLHAEGQRRYVETFSPYMRQFLERIGSPDVDAVENIPPSIALESGTTVQNARSTVGTITEVNDFLKYLYAFRSDPFCPYCGRPVKCASPETVLEYLRKARRDDRLYITAPLDGTSGFDRTARQMLLSMGYVRAVVGGRVVRLDDPDFPENPDEPVWIVQDRVVWEEGREERIYESVKQAFELGKGRMAVLYPDGPLQEFSNLRSCADCGREIPECTPEIFSFNSPVGACPECRGLGRTIGVNMDAVIPDRKKSIRDGAVSIWTPDRYEYHELLEFCRREGIPLDVPFEKLDEADQLKIIEGTDDYYGIKGFFSWLETKTYKVHVRVFLSRYRAYNPCWKCGGTRYGEAARYFRLLGVPIFELQSWSVEKCREFFHDNRRFFQDDPSSAALFEEIVKRLDALCFLRLGYLTLDRPSRTLSGGEVQRVHFVKVLGSSLSNVLYILDEPSLGLHPHDQDTLMTALRRFVENGNTVVIVDHDPQVLGRCDHLIELGPGGGRQGGMIVVEGSPEQVKECPESRTAPYLRKPLRDDFIRHRTQAMPYGFVTVRGARSFNLKNITVSFPLGLFVAVSGVSGAGKTTLVETTLYGQWRRAKGLELKESPGECDAVEGFENISDMLLVDRRPVGRNPRANLLTYTGAMEWVRKLLAGTDDARMKGLTASFFSFNQPGGRCDVCRGEGFIREEMQFLADVYSPCPACKGRRFKDEVLRVKYKGWSIGDFLEATASDVLSFFGGSAGYEKKLLEALKPLEMLNLDTLRLGQPLSTFSAGEAQRLKLAPLLQKSAKKDERLFVILDEPSRGLHPEDLERLVEVFRRIVKRGHTVVVVEHNPILLSACDWIVDLGPEGGARGGEVVFEGPPWKLIECKESLTGRHMLRRLRDSSGEKDTGNRVVCDIGLARRAHSGHFVKISGLRHNNLNIDNLEIPLGRFVAVTGLSGSGKSSLVFDVLHAEGQRRYLECLSAYIRQYFAIFEKPEVDSISGLPPTVAVEQRLTRGLRKSTVGTLTEIYHFLRLLFAKAGRQRCVRCGREVEALSIDEVASKALEYHRKGAILLIPVVYRRKGVYRDLIRRLRRSGFEKARIDGKWVNLSEIEGLTRFEDHTVEVALGVSSAGGNLLEDLLRALRIGEGFITAVIPDGAGEEILSTRFMCLHCGVGYLPLDPRLFSFNSPYGLCHECGGTGVVRRVDAGKVLGKGRISGKRILEAWLQAPFIPQKARKKWKNYWYDTLRLDQTVDGDNLPPDLERTVLYGRDGVPGLIPVLEELIDQDLLPDDVLHNLFEEDCPSCGGTRINEQARSVYVADYSLPDLVKMTIEEFSDVWDRLYGLSSGSILSSLYEEVRSRVEFLRRVGLGYLTLSRSGDTLSGGEFQRIRLAAHLGSGLTGVLYILDEPTIGLHPADTERLIDGLKLLRDRGNSVIVVEHDLETLKNADLLIELGPGGGTQGGIVTGVGTFQDLVNNKETALSRAFGVSSGNARNYRRAAGRYDNWLEIRSTNFRNLRDVDLRIPLGTLTCVTGVSGAGKSTLVYDVLYPLLMEVITGSFWYSAGGVVHSGIKGYEGIHSVLCVDHQPIGRTSRSIPATYLGIWDDIRNIFASLPEAKVRGFRPAHFSFNLRGGRCEFCLGMGYVIEQMKFLPDVKKECPVCRGMRFSRDILEVRYREKNISEVLEMTFEEAPVYFAAYPRIVKTVGLVNELGLGYLRLGQPSPTLSGGEAQRIKLVKELKKNSRPSIFLLDEPTTGLHHLDIKRLLNVLKKLVNRGHTIIAIEHNLDFIAQCDYIIDLGPTGGDAGGRIVAQGTPDEFKHFTDRSLTARALWHESNESSKITG